MKRLFGGILVAVGILIMTGSGVCSLVVMAGSVQGAGFAGLQLAPIVALVGGIPFAVGFGIFRGGRAIGREAERDRLD